MKRQIVLGFTGALIAGVYLAIGACNGHSFKATEFETGVTKLYEHHGDAGHGDGGGHDADKSDHHGDKDGDKHDKAHDAKKGHKEASAQPAKTLFPRK